MILYEMTLMMSRHFFLKHRAFWEEGQEGEGKKDRSSQFLWGFTWLFKDYPEETRDRDVSFTYSQDIKIASPNIRTPVLKNHKTSWRFSKDAAFHGQVRKNH
jgi:hypothetical protein